MPHSPLPPDCKFMARVYGHHPAAGPPGMPSRIRAANPRKTSPGKLPFSWNFGTMSIANDIERTLTLSGLWVI